MYTTALPIAMVKAAHASLILLQTEGWRREKLFTLIAYFKRKAQQLRLPIVVSATPIQPLLIGSVHQTTLMAQYLYRHGFLVHAIRPPTVPRCSSRLRISLNVQHSEAEIDHLLECIAMGIKLLYIN
jgi:8-amino-7-oxononanoate synthase